MDGGVGGILLVALFTRLNFVCLFAHTYTAHALFLCVVPVMFAVYGAENVRYFFPVAKPPGSKAFSSLIHPTSPPLENEPLISF